MAEPISLHARSTAPTGRPLCILVSGNQRWPARIRGLSAASTFLETMGRPPLGHQAILAHPEVGAIVTAVTSHALDGVSLSFEGNEESVAFLLAVTAHDMTVAPEDCTAA